MFRRTASAGTISCMMVVDLDVPKATSSTGALLHAVLLCNTASAGAVSRIKIPLDVHQGDCGNPSLEYLALNFSLLAPWLLSCRAASAGVITRIMVIDLDVHQGNGVGRDKLACGHSCTKR